MDPKSKILIVEDAKDNQLLLKHFLSDSYDLTICDNGVQAQKLIFQNSYDLYLLDIILPDTNGLELCRLIRSQVHLVDKPIILLTGCDQINEKLDGFNAGANDYITKPFNNKELIARINSNIYRNKVISDTSELIIGDLLIVKDKFLVKKIDSNSIINLTSIEFSLLNFFIQRIGRVISREELLNSIWKNNLDISDRTIDSHISHLRKKLNSSTLQIKAIANLGYQTSIS